MYLNCNIDSIGHEIKALDHIMQRKLLNVAKETGIDQVTIMHGWIIGYLRHSQCDIFQKDIESQFAISRSTVTNILKLMEKKGYINRVSVEGDARLKKLVLTSEGEKIYLLMESAADENERLLNSILNDDERSTLITLIRKLRNGLENI